MIKSFLNKHPLTLSLFFSCTVSVFFLILRVLYSGSLMYAFLVWNLFLACIPYLLSLYIYNKYLRKKDWHFYFMSIVWLLFFPNALYIMTDFLHLQPRGNVPLWFDIVLLFSFSWNGILLGFLSLQKMQALFSRMYGWIIVIMSLVLASFGIYLGRYLRWNSWDALTHPLQLLTHILDRIINPFLHPRTYALTFVYAIFFISIYTMFIQLHKSK